MIEWHGSPAAKLLHTRTELLVTTSPASPSGGEYNNKKYKNIAGHFRDEAHLGSEKSRAGAAKSR